MSHLSRCAAALLVAFALVSCARSPREILLASTTSTEDSGLFDSLLPAFEADHPHYRLHVIAVGSGEALRLASRGDADVVLSHSPAAESEFMTARYGESRRRLMYNDFVIVGPQEDMAGIRGLGGAAAAFERIAGRDAPFVSRGDDSGTHAKEKEVWAAVGHVPGGQAYSEAGQGMGAVLMMASEKGAYTLTDRGTYLNLRGQLDLEVLVEGDSMLINQYSVIVVRGAVSLAGAREFADWVTSPRGQRLIADFGRAAYGRPLFIPNARE